MKTLVKLIVIFTLAAVLLSACASAAPAPTAEAMPEKTMASGEKKSGEMMQEDSAGMMEKKKDDGQMASGENGDEMGKDAMQDDSMGDDASKAMQDKAMMDSPAWFTLALTDVASGEMFTIQDFKGKVVLVETMAIWCPTCLRQQNQVKELHEKLGKRDDFISLGLGIDPNEQAEALKEYIARNGFDWRYAISPAEISRELGLLYGDQYLNPPSAPMLIIDREGVVHTLPFGVKSADSLLDALQPFLDS